MVQYANAPEVEMIGQRLIKEHHPHLVGHRVEFIFRGEAQTTNGKEVWGKARKVTGLNAFLATDLPDEEADTLCDVDPFFLIEIAMDVWGRLVSKQRIALVDHELSHCTVAFNNSGGLVMRLATHDVEEFDQVVARHGLYKGDLARFGKVVAESIDNGIQLALVPDPEQ